METHGPHPLTQQVAGLAAGCRCESDRLAAQASLVAAVHALILSALAGLLGRLETILALWAAVQLPLPQTAGSASARRATPPGSARDTADRLPATPAGRAAIPRVQAPHTPPPYSGCHSATSHRTARPASAHPLRHTRSGPPARRRGTTRAHPHPPHPVTPGQKFSNGEFRQASPHAIFISISFPSRNAEPPPGNLRNPAPHCPPPPTPRGPHR